MRTSSATIRQPPRRRALAAALGLLAMLGAAGGCAMDVGGPAGVDDPPDDAYDRARPIERPAATTERRIDDALPTAEAQRPERAGERIPHLDADAWPGEAPRDGRSKRGDRDDDEVREPDPQPWL